MTVVQNAVQFGPMTFTVDELRAIAIGSYRVEAFRPGTNAEQPRDEDYAARRSIYSLFPGREQSAGLYGLWHWVGGSSASTGDLRMVRRWIRSMEMSFYLICSDMPKYIASMDTLNSQIFDSMVTGSDFSTPAKTLAEICDFLADEADEYIGYDDDTPAISAVSVSDTAYVAYDAAGEEVKVDDPYRLFPLVVLLRWLSDLFRAGPDSNGRYLPDDLVWNNFAGPEPLPV